MFRSISHLLILLFSVLMSSFLSFLYILEISSLSNVGLVKIFSHFVSYHFVLLTVSFALWKLLSFRKSLLFIVDLSVSATGIICRSGALCQYVQAYFPLSVL